ncbi:hypothetical protein HDK64DRAFT_280866 [Phyllosticta capitalensis]
MAASWDTRLVLKLPKRCSSFASPSLSHPLLTLHCYTLRNNPSTSIFEPPFSRPFSTCLPTTLVPTPTLAPAPAPAQATRTTVAEPTARATTYCSRDYGSSASNQNSYHYSNTDGSYYYSNSNGSTYYNNGQGGSTYTPPSGK